jgi:hypothetical protein
LETYVLIKLKKEICRALSSFSGTISKARYFESIRQLIVFGRLFTYKTNNQLYFIALDDKQLW